MSKSEGMTSVSESLWLRFRTYRQAQQYLKRGNRAFQKGDLPAAVSAYEEALRHVPSLSLARYNLGMALYKDGRRLEGREHWQRLLAEVQGKNAYLEEQVRIVLRQFG